MGKWIFIIILTETGNEMIRIRKIYNPYLEANIRKMDMVKEIIKTQIPLLPGKKIALIHLHRLIRTLFWQPGGE